ncbi:GTPase IMAP family member 8-like [Coregonus clupeaformis]|uniref:GTPase IMAP family member 8-like n=1 Tax=Coregonus clupeaformis TaxID=59861 RepID=UPI001E1C715F|nr:GTPase IMAP family member 8-like [Coregonus clupeaformis]
MQEMEKCKSLSAPGPHGILLVLKPEEFKEENRKTLKFILSIFGKEAFKHSMVIITHKEDAGNTHLRQMVRECGGRHHEIIKQGSHHKELTEKIEKMVEENEWRYLTSNEETTHDTMTPKAQRLNVVLCGRRGAGKTSTANAILGQRESSPKSSSSSVCVKRGGEVCGRPVTLIELPALYGTHLTQEEVMRETFRCVSLCDSGVHAFLLVVPFGPLTDEDKGELETIQKILSSRVNDFVMVLFRQDYIPVDKTAVDFVEQNADTKQLIKICGGRYKIFDALKIENAKQTTELVAEIVKMMDQNKTCYTLYMYMEAQDLRLEAKHQSELDENNRIIKDLEQKISNMSKGAEMECSSTECVRVVLIGKTGNGKSASANTILGRVAFESESRTDSVTTVCKKAVGKVDGRTVAVVDTPGLFDTTLSNKDVQQEIVKCVSLSAPGPHVFIIVLSIGRITQEELDTLDLIEKTFGPRARMFCLVLFTRGDDLRKQSIQEYIEKSKIAKLKKLIRDCGDRLHVFNNRVEDDRTQVTELLKKINEMVSTNKGSFYTNEMFQEAEAAIKQKQEAILKEREMEIKADMEKLKVSHETAMKKMKSKLEEERLKVQEERQRRENMLRKREEAIRKEHEEKEKAEKEERKLKDKKKKDEKFKKEIWDTEKDKMEKEIKTQEKELEKQQRKNKEEYKMRMEQQRKEEKDREELVKNQERQFAELKRKQDEEMEKREKEEDERRKHEEKERQEWQSKIEEGQTELQEVMRREKEEWEEQLKKERDRQQEEERLRRQKEKDQWEREHREEQERRFLEDANRKMEEEQKIKKLQQEEKRKKEKEDEARKEKEEKKMKEMEEEYERKTKESMGKYEEEARTQAEELNYLRELCQNDQIKKV